MSTLVISITNISQTVVHPKVILYIIDNGDKNKIVTIRKTFG